jgi:hypothetical protein
MTDAPPQCEPTQPTPATAGGDNIPTQRRVRPSVIYLMGRPAALWVRGLGRGNVTIVNERRANPECTTETVR